MTHADRLKRFDDADLYVVITESFCAGRTSVEVLARVLEAGVRLIQLREKDWDDRWLHETALEFRRRTADAGAVLIVDDRVDIALAVEADGVHLGQQDLPIPVARRLAPELLIGASTHNREELLRAQSEGASVVNIGPIFETQTKAVATGALGVETLRALIPDVKTPWSCMGGIKAHTIGELAEAGARHPAVVTAVTAADDITAAARELRKRLGR